MTMIAVMLSQPRPCMYVCMYECMCMYIYTHTYTYAYTYTYTPLPKRCGERHALYICV